MNASLVANALQATGDIGEKRRRTLPGQRRGIGGVDNDVDPLQRRPHRGVLAEIHSGGAAEDDDVVARLLCGIDDVSSDDSRSPGDCDGRHRLTTTFWLDAPVMACSPSW